MKELSIAEKAMLTVVEASIFSNIGQAKIREMIKEPKCDFVLYSGRNVLIKRKRFEDFLESREVI